jgi:hypothetical protein
MRKTNQQLLPMLTRRAISLFPKFASQCSLDPRQNIRFPHLLPLFRNDYARTKKALLQSKTGDHIICYCAFLVVVSFQELYYSSTTILEYDAGALMKRNTFKNYF